MPESFKTTCCYCGVGCGVIVHKDSNGMLVAEGDKGHPVNKGMLCSKGMNLHYTVMDKSDRLLYPEMRYHKQMPRKRVSWDTALERAARVFASIIERYGPESVAFYASGQCLTEEYYIVNKLVKGFIGCNNIDTNSRLCMSSAVAAYKMSLGEDSVPICYDDIEQTDLIFVAGANPAWCHPIVWRRVEAAKAANPDLKIIVSDPRKTQTCSLADVHLQIRPGTDITLHHALARILIENGDIDMDYINHHTEGFLPLAKKVMERTVHEAAIICDVPPEDIYQAASLIAHSKGLLTMWTMGLNQSVRGVDKNLSLINLNLITGRIGRPGCGPFSLTGQPNAMGGREVGGLANILPAHRLLSNEQDRLYVQQFWGGKPIGEAPGLTATQMFDAMEQGSLKAIWIMGTNPLVSLPDVRKAEAALAKAAFVVVQEVSNKPETLQYADLILPAAAWAEKEGTMTNAERRITYLSRITEAPGEARPDAEILCDFATRMGFAGFEFKNSEEIFLEHCRLTEGTNMDIGGLNYAILKEKRSVQWPYPKEPLLQNMPRLFADGRFYTKSGKAIINDPNDENESEPLSEDLPLILTTGRIRDQWHTMTKTGKVNKLKQHIARSFLEIHPEDAFERAISEDELIEVTGVRGTVRVKAKLTSDIKKGVVFLPMHWGKMQGSDLNRANNITNALLDKVSKQPDFKYAAVQVRKYIKPKQRIVIVGAGAGAFGFVKRYRELNGIDEIEVFSKEDQPFYNRVMLPDYISGTQSWEQIVKMTGDEELDHKVVLHRGLSIVSVDKDSKRIKDDKGQWHHYDILILATGSRPFILKDTPKMPGIFAMRTRMDADQFMEHLDRKGGKVVIIGGGLLGIELAGSLMEIGVQSCILQRSSRLMDRQLDSLGCQLLHEELVEKGIEVLFNDEVDRFLGEEKLTGIRLRSGNEITCQAVVMAIGTRPNMELAIQAGLNCKRGVVVNAYLQTSEPDIFAIGEIAEHNGMLFGITAAAEEQAAIVASYLNGDIASYYSGSLAMNLLKVHGIQLCSVGISDAPQGDATYEEVIFLDRAKRYYKKCIVHQDKLVGAILIGDKTEFLEFKTLIENRTELSEKRLELLRSGGAAEPVLGKIVCSCGNVGEGNIINKINDGHCELKALCQASGAGMGCGSCRPEVQAILERSLAASSV
ncbi:ferredoxin-nitrate reductase [Arachidicoccus rhizosphaerae]|uniref:Ferredoxin-nitrate reductase n=1 Tax=Arachidicoccus rhizosphaerae TaxID=551991 RepID=A0A1H3WAC2_9BACT|nr:nitrate reductase [Arachidicoccus rhizosphaerae]SDZ84046.1 ferredoxin-nitrate reductase [Arachidicoccus rhizosphaerae]